MQRTTVTLFATLGLLLAVPACKKEEKPKDKPATEDKKPTTATDSAADAAATNEPDKVEPETDAGAADQAMANKMLHCPSAVEGSKTEVKKEGETVVVTITAGDQAAVAEIRTRAKHLASVSDADSTDVKHTGGGTGGAELGKCPVAIADAKAKAEDVENGSKVTLTPVKPDDLKKLFLLAQERAEAMTAGTGGGHEGGHGSGSGGGSGGGGSAGEGGADSAGTDKKPHGNKDPAPPTDQAQKKAEDKPAKKAGDKPKKEGGGW